MRMWWSQARPECRTGPTVLKQYSRNACALPQNSGDTQCEIGAATRSHTSKAIFEQNALNPNPNGEKGSWYLIRGIRVNKVPKTAFDEMKEENKKNKLRMAKAPPLDANGPSMLLRIKKEAIQIVLIIYLIILITSKYRSNFCNDFIEISIFVVLVLYLNDMKHARGKRPIHEPEKSAMMTEENSKSGGHSRNTVERSAGKTTKSCKRGETPPTGKFPENSESDTHPRNNMEGSKKPSVKGVYTPPTGKIADNVGKYSRNKNKNEKGETWHKYPSHSINYMLNYFNHLLNYLKIYYQLGPIGYIIVWTYMIFYWGQPEIRKHHNEPYIPKWKRWKKLDNIKDNVYKHLTWLGSLIEVKINSFQVKRQKQKKFCQIKKAAAKSAGKHYGHKKLTPFKMAILAYSMMAYQSSVGAARYKRASFDTDSKAVGVDNRASACISNDIADFIETPRECSRTIKSFGGVKTRKVMRGTICWRWCDELGIVHKFIIPNSYYIPEGGCKLLSPQHWAKTQANGKGYAKVGETTTSRNCTLFWQSEAKQCKLVIPLDPSTNVATFHLAPGFKQFSAFCAEAKIDPHDDKNVLTVEAATLAEPMDEDEEFMPFAPSSMKTWKPSQQPTTCEFDLDGPQGQREISTQGRMTTREKKEDKSPTTELLKIHQKMGHLPFAKLQLLAQQGAMPKHLANCEVPVCSSCMFSKMGRKPWRGKPSLQSARPTHTLKPGEVVSVDQLVSPTVGFIAQLTGILTTQRYRYATIYVDQATRYGYVFLQKTATVEETLKGKNAFEQHASSMGISIKGYHADNGIFRANAWMSSCNQQDQAMTFAGVNAHHQNGVAERRIKELQDMARTMLIHANNRWPQCITANLWPYAVRAASEALNNAPSFQHPKRKSPLQLFSKSEVLVNPKHYQPFGCPAYVLDNALQAQQPFHKWNQRSRVGIYLGHSPYHGKNVALILDRTTGLVSPQFHVRYDPQFHTVKQDYFDSQWQIKAGLKRGNTSATRAERAKRRHQDMSETLAETPVIPTSEGGMGMFNSEGVESSKTSTNASNSKREGDEQRTNAGQSKADLDRTNPPRKVVLLQHKPGAYAPSTQIRRSKRLKTLAHPRQEGTILKPSLKRSGERMVTTPGPSGQVRRSPRLMNLMTTEISESTKCDIQGELFCYEALFPMEEKEEEPLLVFKATADPDTMYMHQAMKEPDRAEFIKAMEKEVKDQMDNGNFSIVLASSVPKGTTIFPAVWQMKRKRDIKTRKVKKYKARLNVDGSRMKQGIHYDQSYAPVASWRSIRLLLILIAQFGWHSKQLDYVLAFPQAPVAREIYMKIPKGFEIKGANPDKYVLKLHRNVYGQKNAGRVWNDYLVDKLVNKVGFTQSKIDECVFYKGRTVYVLYTDDSILAGPDMDEINRIVEEIKAAKLDITDEGDIQDFLGINISIKKGEIHLAQPHLIDQILKDLRLDGEKVKTKEIPAMTSKILTRDQNGEDFDKSFHYRSIIGKLNYLERGTRSDISYITHQCARFVENPKESHAKAVRWLGRYLRSTKDKGLILKPDSSRDLEVFVDADFSGNWDSKNAAQDRDTARSRHGYIISYKGCPIIWKSQMQTEIALSSTESEYMGLSYALREAIPIMDLLKEMQKHKFPIGKTKASIHCKVFEDNSGALEMAKTHKYRPRTKHLNVKYHHFRDYITRGNISVHKIDTSDQCADYLTKPVNLEVLSKLRKRVMGW